MKWPVVVIAMVALLAGVARAANLHGVPQAAVCRVAADPKLARLLPVMRVGDLISIGYTISVRDPFRRFGNAHRAFASGGRHLSTTGEAGR